MNKATAAKVIKAAGSMKGPESSGFKRYLALPKKCSYALKVAHYLNGNSDESFVSAVKELFGSMTDAEFKTWLLNN